MQNRDSLRWGLRLANALGPPVGKFGPAAGGDGTLEKGKPGNPWRDEFGRFTDEGHAIFNVNAKLPAAELEARAKEYEQQAGKRQRKAELDGIEGLKKGFLHYTPKGMQEGNESPEWHKLNRAVGKAEAVANEYLDRYRAAGEGLTEEGRALINYWLSNASALRDMSRILAGKRDGGDAPVHEHDAPTPEAEQATTPAAEPAAAPPSSASAEEDDESPGSPADAPESPKSPKDLSTAASHALDKVDWALTAAVNSGGKQASHDDLSDALHWTTTAVEELHAAGLIDDAAMAEVKQLDGELGEAWSTTEDDWPEGYYKAVGKYYEGVGAIIDAAKNQGAEKSLAGFLSPFLPLSRNYPRPTPTHRWLSKSGFPDFIQEAFDVIDEQENGNGDGEFSAEHATRAKAYVVNNAVQVGLLDREAANDILSAIGAEEVQEEPK